jgi:sulfur carrier protein ThiS
MMKAILVSTMLAAMIPVVFVASGCAHHRAADAASHPVLDRAHAMPSWSGVIRISAGNSSREFAQNPKVVEETVQGLVDSLGLDARVHCMETDGDLGVKGAIHARVSVNFPDKLTVEEKFEVMHLLENMKPSEGAYILRENGSPAPSAAMAAIADR